MGRLYRPPGRLSAKPVGIEPESFGRRVGKLRAELGWTQARLAARVGVSRVGLSHIEAGVSIPNERTVTLLAGVFAQEPHELVSGTNYPVAKAERLPLVTARHTEVAHQLAVLRVADDVADEWRGRLAALLDRTEDPDERRHVRAALHDLLAR